MSFIKYILTYLALIYLTGCNSIPVESDLDLRESDSSHENKDIKFQDVRQSRKLSPELLNPSRAHYRIGIGDEVEIEIVGILGTREITFVMPDGMIYYNLAGGVKAEDLSVTELAERLAEKLKLNYSSPQISITLKEIKSRRFWILGQVFKPGLYPLTQPTTLIEAISLAGGLFTSRFTGTTEELADLNKSFLIRDDKILPVDFHALMVNGDMGQNIYLEPNDYIYLPAITSNAIYVLGAVRKPQAVGTKDRISIVSAIAKAKGPRKNAYLKKVIVVRGSLSEPKVGVVNFKDILEGKSANFNLLSGDIVWVPKSPWEKLDKYFNTVVDSAARTIAVNEGARASGAGVDTETTITLPVGSGL